MAIKINGQPVKLISPDDNIVVEIDNSDDQTAKATFRFTDTGQTDPAGRFQVQVSGDTFLVQGAYFADWAQAQTLLAFDRDGITDLRFTEDGLVSLLTQLRLFAGAYTGVRVHLHKLLAEITG